MADTEGAGDANSAIAYRRQLDEDNDLPQESWSARRHEDDGGSDEDEAISDNVDAADRLRSNGGAARRLSNQPPRRAFDDSDVSLLSPMTGHIRRPTALSVVPFRAPLLNKVGDEEDAEEGMFKELAGTPHTSALAVQHSSHKTGLFMTTWNLFNDVLSSGAVALPYYCAQAGLGMYVVLLIVYAVLCDFTLMMCYDLATRHNLTSFAECCHFAFGRAGYLFASVIMFIFNWGGYVGNLVVLGNVLPDLMVGYFGEYEVFRRQIILVIAVVIFSPMAYYKGLGRFAWASFLAVVAMIFVILLVLYRYFFERSTYQQPEPAHAFTFVNSNFLPVLGGISFIYTCQDMFFHVFHSLHDPTRKRVAIVAHSIMLSTMAILASFGICGYFLFYQNVDDDILSNFGAKDQMIQVARLMVAFNIVVSVPYCNFIPRVAVLAVVQMYFPQWAVKDVDNPQSNRFKRNVVHFIVTTVLLGSGLVVALFVTNLGVAFEFVGGISAVCISLIIPPLCFLKLETDASRIKRASCYVVLLLGAVGTVGVISKIAMNG